MFDMSFQLVRNSMLPKVSFSCWKILIFSPKATILSTISSFLANKIDPLVLLMRNSKKKEPAKLGTTSIQNMDVPAKFGIQSAKNRDLAMIQNPGTLGTLWKLVNGCLFPKLKDQISPHVKPSDCYETKVMTWDGESRWWLDGKELGG